jgi:HEAT repeat protein
LAFIKDPSAALALVHALEDEDQYVRLAAMGALIALNREGLEPLLRALTQDFGSARLREGAHNILNILKNQKYLRRPCVLVLQALDSADPEVNVPWVAKVAWESLFGLKRSIDSTKLTNLKKG